MNGPDRQFENAPSNGGLDEGGQAEIDKAMRAIQQSGALQSVRATAEGEQSFAEAQRESMGTLQSERAETPDVALQSERADTQPDVALQSVHAIEPSMVGGGGVNIDVQREISRAGKTTLAGAAVGGTVYGATTAVGAVSAGASPTAATLAGGLAAGAGALQVGVGALSLYTGGMLHNLVWAKNGKKKPGLFGTALRGVISPVSVPVGVGYRFLRGK